MPAPTMRGVARLIDEEDAATRRMIDQLPPGNQLAIIMADYSLQIIGFRGTDETPITIPPSAYIVDVRLCTPYDFFTQTPDGSSSYVTPADPLTPHAAPGLEGEHLHNPDGDHGIYGGSHTHAADSGGHFHRVLTPPWLRPLMPGDRVKISWIDGGSQRARTACIDARVVSGSYMTTLATGGGAWQGPTPPFGTAGAPGAATYAPAPSPYQARPSVPDGSTPVIGIDGRQIGYHTPDGTFVPTY